MFACICHAVPEAEVVDAVLMGADTVEELGEMTDAGTGCGTCHQHLDDLIEANGDRCPLAGLRMAS